MRVLMAANARERFKLILRRKGRVVARHRFMALGTCGGGMPSIEVEAGLLMARQGEGGRTKTIQGVAKLAAVEVWSRGELPPMDILMAIGAGLVLDAVQRLRARRQMALSA